MAHALLEGKSIVVTGAGRSLGAVIAERCAAEGAHVVATDITGDGAGTVVGHDITNITDWKRVIADAVTSNGRVDGLVNNAAIIYGSRPFWDETPEEFARILDVNVMGTWLGLQVASRAIAGKPLVSRTVWNSRLAPARSPMAASARPSSARARWKSGRAASARRSATEACAG